VSKPFKFIEFFRGNVVTHQALISKYDELFK